MERNGEFAIAIARCKNQLKVKSKKNLSFVGTVKNLFAGKIVQFTKPEGLRKEKLHQKKKRATT